METVRKSIWVAISDQYEFTEHSEKQSALDTMPLILIFEREGTWRNGTYSNKEYSAELYNKNGVKVDGITINNWRISNLRISATNSYDKKNINFNIIDQWGKSKERYFGDERAGITNALMFFKSASKYSSWTKLEEDVPEEMEKSEIHLLKKEVEKLKIENKLLNTKIEAIRNLLINEAGGSE